MGPLFTAIGPIHQTVTDAVRAGPGSLELSALKGKFIRRFVSAMYWVVTSHLLAGLVCAAEDR
jgi:hypothetical protein